MQDPNVLGAFYNVFMIVLYSLFAYVFFFSGKSLYEHIRVQNAKSRNAGISVDLKIIVYGLYVYTFVLMDRKVGSDVFFTFSVVVF